ncbi:hypothetical protein A2U01_0082074, partial [Trifolium medium]|nr:hypothetical protein [Trifolium medium]
HYVSPVIVHFNREDSSAWCCCVVLDGLRLVTSMLKCL